MNSKLQKRILVTGGSGQLATSLTKLGGGIICVGRPEFDLDKDETIHNSINIYNPDIVINAAAWTAVDLAEKNIIEARTANAVGPATLASICEKKNIALIHISTDYVYSGDKGVPYKETDLVDPKTVYGHTKVEGEKAIIAKNPDAIILRTSWVYAPHGKNFVKTIINAGAKNSKLKVVNDQYGNPTNADDLAIAIKSLVDQLNIQKNAAGIYHVTGKGSTSWYKFATFILKEAQKYGQPMPNIVPIQTDEWPTAAKRPKDSRLDCVKIKQSFGIELPTWQSSVARTVQQIFQQKTV
ncbi:dTDP-4-dehydrorhamnose reductase [Zymomonas mobilis]|uniref:dTDP-4-dehydrorhamnose reductase n=1 Tax=Zymomonas mobilis TaxID=542 RepID=A0A542W1Z4_ZYMMB|nr:dTDP-4-dehydrorhamnose reductase [Zymomonas mobilis]TQL17606.1 dTDP-4-dehydrorhamnose reductase [Zymomonas mobilis]